MKSIFSILIFVISIAAQAQSANEPITNFHMVTDGIYRGAHPTPVQIQFLAQAGVKTVINLQGGDINNPLIGFAVPWFVKGESLAEINHEGSWVVSSGMGYLSLPLSSLRPLNRLESKSIVRALKTMNDPSKQPVFLHCAHGKDRTGLVIALYRMIYQNWTLQEAQAEMIAKGHDGMHRVLTFSLDQYLYSYALVSYIREILPLN
jgi:protein tyrosine/serine phosphatase